MKKAAYSIITAFLFIVAMLVSVLGILYYETIIATVEKSFNDDLNQYEIVKDARNRLYYCYGNTIDPVKFNKTCDISVIKGYKIERYESETCTELNHSSDIDRYSQKFVYAAPIKESGSICLGKIEVYV